MKNTHICYNISRYNTYAKISLLASFHAGCDRNRSVESPEACHRIGTRRGGAR